MAIDPNSLPRDAESLRKIVVDLAEQLDRSLAEQNKYQSLLRELLEAQRNRKSEQLSKEQLALFAAAWQARSAKAESAVGEDDDDLGDDPGTGAKPNEMPNQKRGGRQALARHLKRERIVHDLTEADKHCAGCGKDLRLIAEETSERYEYIPASMKVIQDVCLKYACDCTVRTATKPQPIGKSTAGASLLAQVIVAKWADHQPLHRQEKMFERNGSDISRKTIEAMMAFFAYFYERPARRHFRWWHNWATRSRLRPMIEKARMIKRRFENIVTYLKHRITNAASESINSKIQWVKYTARGFRSKANFITAICGGLDLMPSTH